MKVAQVAHEHSEQWTEGGGGWGAWGVLVVDEPVHIIIALILHKSNDWNLNSNYNSKKNSRTAPLF